MSPSNSVNPALGNQFAASVLAAGNSGNVDGAIDNISVDSIMAYCTTRMRDLDAMLRSKMQQQMNQNNLSKQWSNLVSLMQHCAAGGIGQGADQSGGKAVSDQLLTQYKATNDPILQSKIADLFQKFTGADIKDGPVANPKPPNAVSAQEFAGFIDEIKTAAGSVAQGSDLAMVDIQRLVGERQQAMQLTTQMMSTEHETYKTAIGNIR